MTVFIPHIFSPDLANFPILSDNRIGIFHQVGNSCRLRDVLFFLRPCPRSKLKSTNRKKLTDHVRVFVPTPYLKV